MVKEIKFAGTVVKVDDVVVAKVTEFNTSTTVNEEEITGAEDVVSGGDIVQQQFTSVSVNETATVSGIAIEGDAGQSALADAARSGATVDMAHIKPNGTGRKLTGFFTAYSENGGLSGGIYNWSGTFRINAAEPIVPTP